MNEFDGKRNNVTERWIKLRMRFDTVRRKIYLFVSMILVGWFAASSIPVPTPAQVSKIRSVNFREFSYHVGPPYCEEFGEMVTVHKGSFANKQATFTVSRVFYDHLTATEPEEAIVVATCAPTVQAHPGFENNLVYVYGVVDGQLKLLATFAFGEPWDFHGRATEPKRDDQLVLSYITRVSATNGSILIEHLAGAARCCPTFYVTQIFRWKNGRFELAGEQRRRLKAN